MQQDTMDLTHYGVLGVPEDATTEEIQQAYRTLIREIHPDSKPQTEKDYYTKLSQAANDARDVLTRPNERAKYDLLLKQAREWADADEAEEEAGDFVVDDEEHAYKTYGDYETPPTGETGRSSAETEPRTESQPAPAPAFMARVENVLESFPPVANALLATLLSSTAWVIAILATTALDAVVVGILLVLIVPLLCLPLWIAAGKLRRIRDQIAHGASMAQQLVLLEMLRRNPVTAAVVDFAVSAEERIGVPVTATHRATRAIALGPVMTIILVIPPFSAILPYALVAAIVWAVAWVSIIVMRWRRGRDPL